MNILLCFLVVGGALASGFALSAERPKLELGVALGGQVLNDYRGSKESQTQAYPVPILIYRGDFIKADRNGLRGEFLSTNQVELNISGEAALNGSSEDNRLRQGMPELESAFELGPSLNINLTGEDFSRGWQLRLPLRAVTTIGESGVHFRGYNFNPRFTYTAPNILGQWRAKVNVGVLYSSRKYHDYYYSVDQEFVTADRARYQAAGGYSGSYTKFSLGRRNGNFFYGLSLRYDNLKSAKFDNSPLVETKDYFAFSFAAAWMLWP